MNTSELAKLVSRKIYQRPFVARKITEACFETITDVLAGGDQLNLSGFGKFFTVHYPAKTILDPQGRGHKIVMLPTNVAKFRPSPKLKEKMPKIEPEENKPAPPTAPPKSEPKNNLTSEKRSLPSKVVNIQFRDLTNLKVDKEVLGLIPHNIAERYKVAPIELESGRLTVAMADPENLNTIQLLKKITQLEILPVLSTSDEIDGIIDQYTALQEQLEDVIAHSELGITSKEIKQAEKENIVDTVENSPTIRIVFSLLKQAVREKASDIHIEPQEGDIIVRFRIDGILQKRVVLPKAIHPSIIARLKIMANVKIDEQRLPQDGRFRIAVDQNEVDFRFSTMPCVNGEKAVMRILDKSQGILSLEEIGLTGFSFEILSKNIKRSHGMTLVTGPTGSGKTTTLYAVLGKLMNATVNIVTLEDPVEYRISEINQSQINSEIGYSFASSLRTVVRQDPDIIMLGEIRDRETAEMAVHAALTGHIVLSTLHTNDAAGAIPRLVDMGIEPFLLASSINTVIGQRLTRKLCLRCREEVQLGEKEMGEITTEIAKMSKEAREEIKKKKLTFYRGRGCSACNNSGYKGRQGVFEILDVSETIRELVIARSTSGKIAEQAIAQGMTTMLQDGITKALEGTTSIEEVWRVTRE